MTRWVCFIVCSVLGLVMLLGGLLMPMHLRGVEASVIEKAGRNTPGLIERGLALVNSNELGAAQLLFQAANAKGLAGHERLGEATDRLALQRPDLVIWGSASDHTPLLLRPATSHPRVHLTHT